MKDASTQAEPICSENYSARLNLLRGFLALCYPDEQRLNAVEKLIEAASIQGVKQWRRLPGIVANSHISLLQLSQQIMELQEATTIHTGLQTGGLNKQLFQTEVTTIFKTWKYVLLFLIPFSLYSVAVSLLFFPPVYFVSSFFFFSLSPFSVLFSIIFSLSSPLFLLLKHNILNCFLISILSEMNAHAKVEFHYLLQFNTV